MKKTYQKGFSFVEVLVTIAIFMLIMTAIMSIFLSVINAQRRVTAQRKIQQDMRYVTERIERDIRTGKIDYASQSGFIGATELYVIPQDGSVVQYAIQGGAVVRNGERLTSSATQIDRLSFLIYPDESSYQGGSSNEQVRVTMYVKAHVRILQETSETIFQTTISNRSYEK